MFSLKAEHAAMVEAFALTGVVCNGGLIEKATVSSIAALLTALIGDTAWRQTMSDRGLAITDGQGAKRVVAGIRDVVAA